MMHACLLSHSLGCGIGCDTLFYLFHDKLQWQHQYHWALEEVFLLDNLLSADESAQSSDLTSPAGSLLEHQYRHRLAEVSARAALLQQKHNVGEPWTQQDEQYHQAALDRKCFWVHHYQNAIAADIDTAHVLQLAAQRTSRHHRGTNSSFKKQLNSLHKRIDKSNCQLRQWHLVSGDIGEMQHVAAHLSAQSLLEHGCSRPWLTLYQAGSSLQHRIADAQQRMQRYSEEQASIRKEAADAIIFYTHQLQAVEAAVQARQVTASTRLLHTSDSF